MQGMRTFQSYLIGIDGSGRESVYRLSCNAVSSLALWPGHDQLVISCFGSVDGAEGGPDGDGEVELFDISCRRVVKTWGLGADMQSVIVGDTALVVDAHEPHPGDPDWPAATGPIVIDLASGQFVKDMKHEAQVCPTQTVERIAPTGLASPAAMVECTSPLGPTRLVPVDIQGNPIGQPVEIPVPEAAGFLLYSASAQQYAFRWSGFGNRVPLFSTRADVAPKEIAFGRGAEQVVSGFALAGGVVFVALSSPRGETTLERYHRGPEGLHLTDSVPVDSGTLFATSAHEVWAIAADHVTRVRFP
jgi:hypothetical protein